MRKLVKDWPDGVCWADRGTTIHYDLRQYANHYETGKCLFGDIIATLMRGVRQVLLATVQDVSMILSNSS